MSLFYIYINTHICMYTYILIFMCMCTHVHVYMCVYTHAQTHTHISQKHTLASFPDKKAKPRPQLWGQACFQKLKEGPRVSELNLCVATLAVPHSTVTDPRLDRFLPPQEWRWPSDHPGAQHRLEHSSGHNTSLWAESSSSFALVTG